MEWSSSHCGVRLLSVLVPDLEEAVPGPCRHSHPVISHPQAADAVVMPGQDTCPVGLESVPDVAVEVVVPCEEEAPTLGEGDRGDPAYDVVVGVSHELLIRTKVKQPAGSVVRASGKCIAVWKELEKKANQDNMQRHKK